MPLIGGIAFRRLVWASVVAGVIAGVCITVIQQYTTAPLIARAETYERSAATRRVPTRTAEHDHQHGEALVGAPMHPFPVLYRSSWEPDDGFERLAYTALANTLTAFGYALLIGAVMLHIKTTGLRAGLVVGAVGFLVFQLAPAIGLPPEPPGVPMADLGARQIWWWGTVIATMLAVASWYRARNHARSLWISIGFLLIILPHVVGAPQLPTAMPVVPDELARRFSVLAIGVTAVLWLLLGALAGLLHGEHRVRKPVPSPRLVR